MQDRQFYIKDLNNDIEAKLFKMGLELTDKGSVYDPKTNKIGVVYNNCFGGMDFHSNRSAGICWAILNKTYINKHVENLSVHWVKKGLKYFIFDYDGMEDVITEEDLPYKAE